jgi:hypothetical protein
MLIWKSMNILPLAIWVMNIILYIFEYLIYCSPDVFEKFEYKISWNSIRFKGLQINLYSNLKILPLCFTSRQLEVQFWR